MKNIRNISIIFAVAVMAVFNSCKDNIDPIPEQQSQISSPQFSKNENLERAIQPVILGKKLQNPYSTNSMQAALDSLKAHPEQLKDCMLSPDLINKVEIKTTDLYVRFLPADSSQYMELHKDTMLTLFDFPLDYEIVQHGDYYIDPEVKGDFTWLYTRVPKDYNFQQHIKYEILSELFLYENSKDFVLQDGEVNNKEIDETKKDFFKTLTAVAFFNTGNEYGKDIQEDGTGAVQKIRKAVKKKFLWHTWTDYEYFPSGYIKVQNYHNVSTTGTTNNYNTLTAVPLKGIKVHFWSWFTWNSVYTNASGYYESNVYYDCNPGYYIYFSGKNGNNTWDLDRVILWGICMWVQKLSLGVHSKNGYDETITSTSDAWVASLTNNAFYEYITTCNAEGITCPPNHLQVALRVGLTGSYSTPLFQAHTNNITNAVMWQYFTYTFFSGGATALQSVAYLIFKSSLPDVLLSGGNIAEHTQFFMNDTNYVYSEAFAKKAAVYAYYASVWHELTHASHYRRMEINNGRSAASSYWNSLINTEVGHTVLGNGHYGSKGDNGWERIALAEGWANYKEWYLAKKYLKWNILKNNLWASSPGSPTSYTSESLGFPKYYSKMFESLVNVGCTFSNIEKSLSNSSITGFRNNLITLYPDLSTQITNTIQPYE